LARTTLPSGAAPTGRSTRPDRFVRFGERGWTAQTSWREGALERGHPTLGSLKLCRAGRTTKPQPLRRRGKRHAQAHERRLRGRNLGRKTGERSAGSRTGGRPSGRRRSWKERLAEHRVIPAAGTDSADAQIRGPKQAQARYASPKGLSSADGMAAVQHPARWMRDDGTATAEGKPSKAQAHERHRHETRPEGARAEQDVKRSRKPEGVAESGLDAPAGRTAHRATTGSRCSRSHAL
jgi:hypothetical protein